jgi:hypothetical protein
MLGGFPSCEALSVDLRLLFLRPKRRRGAERRVRASGRSVGGVCEDVKRSCPGRRPGVLGVVSSKMVAGAVAGPDVFQLGGKSRIQGVLGLRGRGGARLFSSITGERPREGNSAMLDGRVSFMDSPWATFRRSLSVVLVGDAGAGFSKKEFCGLDAFSFLEAADACGRSNLS